MCHRAGQQVGPGGLIRLVAPSGFSFGLMCNATDLPAPYYATQANPVDATLPLPGIMTCISRGSDLRTAEMRLERILHGGRAWVSQGRCLLLLRWKTLIFFCTRDGSGMIGVEGDDTVDG
eukprot:symbB.v1.2.000764.t1/scaffold8.1/size549585/2